MACGRQADGMIELEFVQIIKTSLWLFTCDSVTITQSVVNVVPGCVFHSIISYVYDCFKNVVEETTHPKTDMTMCRPSSSYTYSYNLYTDDNYV